MEINSLLRQAHQAFQVGDTEEALLALKKAGELGNISAALDFAYFSASENIESVITYLQSFGYQSEIIQYHAALIDRFYYSRQFTDDIICTLVRLANGNHAESILVLLSWCTNDVQIKEALQSRLFRSKPNIYRQLIGNDKSEASQSDIPILSESIIEVIRKREYELKNLIKVKLNEEIGLIKVPGALSDFECNYVIQRYSSLLSPSLVIHPVTGQALRDDIRTSYVATISAELSDWIIRDIDLRMAYISGTVADRGEPLNLLRYQNNEEYRGHYDAFSAEELTRNQTVLEGGQRTQTVLGYLNSIDDDAFTNFPRLGVKIAPEKGACVVFRNIDVSGNILRNSYHSGEPSAGSVKWTLTRWIRENTTRYGKFCHGNQT